MSLFLAVDAGGTKTDYLLADEASELARVRGGTIKRMRANSETTTRNLDEALTELAVISGISLQSITRTCIGTAGETVALVVDWHRESFAARVGGDLIVLGDVEIALDAAFPGEPGVLVLAGTGSNVAARDKSDRVITAGGWGPTLADQGSGHRIGLQALRALFLAIDQEQPTDLLSVALEHWQLKSIPELVAFANRVPSPDFSQLAQAVVRSAENGDKVAKAVLEKEGQDLAYLVCLLIERLRKSPGQADILPPLAFAGSIMEKVVPVRTALIAAVDQNFPGVVSLDGVVDPIQGALWRARRGR